MEGGAASDTGSLTGLGRELDWADEYEVGVEV